MRTYKELIAEAEQEAEWGENRERFALDVTPAEMEEFFCEHKKDLIYLKTDFYQTYVLGSKILFELSENTINNLSFKRMYEEVVNRPSFTLKCEKHELRENIWVGVGCIGVLILTFSLGAWIF